MLKWAWRTRIYSSGVRYASTRGGRASPKHRKLAGEPAAPSAPPEPQETATDPAFSPEPEPARSQGARRPSKAAPPVDPLILLTRAQEERKRELLQRLDIYKPNVHPEEQIGSDAIRRQAKVDAYQLACARLQAQVDRRTLVEALALLNIVGHVPQRIRKDELIDVYVTEHWRMEDPDAAAKHNQGRRLAIRQRNKRNVKSIKLPASVSLPYRLLRGVALDPKGHVVPDDQGNPTSILYSADDDMLPEMDRRMAALATERAIASQEHLLALYEPSKVLAHFPFYLRFGPPRLWGIPRFVTRLRSPQSRTSTNRASGAALESMVHEGVQKAFAIIEPLMAMHGDGTWTLALRSGHLCHTHLHLPFNLYPLPSLPPPRRGLLEEVCEQAPPFFLPDAPPYLSRLTLDAESPDFHERESYDVLYVRVRVGRAEENRRVLPKIVRFRFSKTDDGSVLYKEQEWGCGVALPDLPCDARLILTNTSRVLAEQGPEHWVMQHLRDTLNEPPQRGIQTVTRADSLWAVEQGWHCQEAQHHRSPNGTFTSTLNSLLSLSDIPQSRYFQVANDIGSPPTEALTQSMCQHFIATMARSRLDDNEAAVQHE